MMIAMTILSFIALAIYQNTTQSFVLRDNVEQEGDFYNSIRIALDSVTRDINHMYSPQANALPEKMGKAEATPPGQQAVLFGSPTLFWGAPINKEGVRPSRFQGDATKITFITNNHVRLFRDAQESDFAAVTYTVDEDKFSPKEWGAKALIKKEDFMAFEDSTRATDPESQTTFTLLGAIKSIEFKFLDGEKDSWNSKWDTTGMDHRDIFPSVVQLTLEMLNPSATAARDTTKAPQNTLKVVQRFKPELPL